MASVRYWQVRLSLVRLDFLETLPSIVSAWINTVLLECVLDLLVLAGCHGLGLASNLHTDGLAGFLVALSRRVDRFCSPEGAFKVIGHSLGHTMLDEIGQEVRVNVLEVIVLPMLVDLRALPSDMADVTDTLTTVGASALREANVLQVVLSPGASGGNMTIDFPFFLP